MTDSSESNVSASGPDPFEGDFLKRLGGPERLQRVVDAMYTRVLADSDLAPFFEGVQIDKLVRMQTEFIASISDGSIEYTGADLTKVHAGRGITAQHFSQFCGHLIDSMKADGVEPLVIDQVLGRLAMYSDKITGSTNVDG